MNTNLPTGSFDAIDGIIGEYLQAVEAGNAPSRESLLKQHLDHAVRLEQFFRDFDAVGRDASKFRLPPSNRTSETIMHDKASPTQLPKIQYLGDYELQSEIARGGMGVVYRARQVSLNRPVAVKMILAGTYATPEAVQRFRAEAEAAANLDHPNILPIYEVGEHEGHQYFSMKLVDGGSLSGKIDELKSKPKQIAELMATLARAVHFAHQRGILHRDLKPANVLMDADGTPYVTDFGLAKKVDSDDGATRTGSIVGTPSYMAPEQARGEKGLTTSVDVYSLGAILYEMLTGMPPFKGETIFETVKQVIEREPAHPLGDQDLATIAIKCLAKEPGNRYPGAGDLAADLERYIRGEAIEARPVGRTERAIKWMRRNRLLTGSIFSIATILIVATVVSLLLANEAMLSRKTAERERAIAQSAADELRIKTTELAEQLTETRRLLDLGKLRDADAARDDKRLGDARSLLAQIAPANRCLAWGILNRLCEGGIARFEEDGGWVASITLSPDEKRMATASSDRSIRIWDITTRKVVHTLKGHENRVSAVSWSPDGKTIISGSEDKSIRLWNAQTGEQRGKIGWHSAPIASLALSPDGNHLASLDGDGMMYVGSLTEHQPRWNAKAHDNGGTCIAWSPDGKRVASCSYNDQLIVWDADQGRKLLTIHAKSEQLLALAWSGDGTMIATGSRDCQARVWDAMKGELRQSYAMAERPIMAVRFTPDGKRLIAGSNDSGIYVWDVESGQILRRLLGHTSGLMSLAVAREKARFFSGDQAGVIQMWDTETMSLRFACV